MTSTASSPHSGHDRRRPRPASGFTAEPQAAPVAAFGRCWRSLRKFVSISAAGALLAAFALVSGAQVAPAVAIPRGEVLRLPSGLEISNFAMPDGTRAYCIEVELAEPSGFISEAGKLGYLPGRPGRFPEWRNTDGIRQMNYLITYAGQSRDPWYAAGVQLSIWRMRADFGTDNAALNRIVSELTSTKQGRDLIQLSDGLVAEARTWAKAPVPPKAVTGRLDVVEKPKASHGRYHVTFPKGTERLSLRNGTFSENGRSSVSVPTTAAGEREVVADRPGDRLEVTGTWTARGTPGFEALLNIYNSATGAGAVGQRIAVATGAVSAQDLRGEFPAADKDVPLPDAPPVASSLAQSTADVGGMMRDVLIVAPAPGTKARAWPNAEADFTAYLQPEPGAPKFDEQWEPTTETWSEEELDEMTEEERCVAQPVYRETGIAVPGIGEYETQPVEVRGPGTIHWVERVISDGEPVHSGACGLSNETTRIDLPGVTTRSLATAKLGEEISDVATVSGRLGEGIDYELRFDAYAAPTEMPAAESGRDPHDANAAPQCSTDNLVFRSELVPVTAPGEYRSPGFVALWEHGERIWWIETLYANGRAVHVGECGLEHETTRIGRPTVETLALEHAAIGDHLYDVASVDGDFSANERAQWELTFEGFGEAYADEGRAAPSTSDTVGRGTPLCTEENRRFVTEPLAVAGPGEYRSPEVTAEPGWGGDLWWVETLWLVEDGERVPVHTGECGLSHETTRVVPPEVATEAADFVAVGDILRDTALITGELSRREGVEHEVVFAGFRGDASATGTDSAVCNASNLLFETAAVPVSLDDADGAGGIAVVSPDVTALPEYGDTVWWVETLRMREGERVTELHRGACGFPAETTTVNAPRVRTESAGTVLVGEEMFDTAIVEGILSSRDDVEYRVTFSAFRYAENGEVSCTPDNEMPEFSDDLGAVVDQPGAYESRRVRTDVSQVGIGGYVETLSMRVEGETHVIHVGECGASSERFEVRSTAPALAETGGSHQLRIWILGGGLLGGGGALLAVLMGRRRSR